MTKLQGLDVHRRRIKWPSMISISATVLPAPADPTSGFKAAVTACAFGVDLQLAQHPTTKSQTEIRKTYLILLNFASANYFTTSCHFIEWSGGPSSELGS
jgi:hypothetical protein